MKRIVLGETLPLEVISVEKVENREKYRTFLKDDDGDVSTVFLDVELPIGRAELKISAKTGETGI